MSILYLGGRDGLSAKDSRGMLIISGTLANLSADNKILASHIISLNAIKPLCLILKSISDLEEQSMLGIFVLRSLLYLCKDPSEGNHPDNNPDII